MICLTILFGLYCLTVSAEYKAVDELYLPSYMGKWYQVYQDNFNKLFQGIGKCSTATYKIVGDNKVSVFNKQIDEQNEIDQIAGYAYYKDDDYGGYLTVKLKDLPEAPYWVLELGPIADDLYDYSIVSDDKALSLFVLTRDVDKFYKNYNDDVLKSLENFGFTKKYNMPMVMNQTDCFS
jgi:lipocalin